jgi:purine-nucleoside phosphorylase
VAKLLLSETVLRPKLAMVLGSGFQKPGDYIDGVVFPYETVPGFPKAQVAGHDGKVVIGYKGGTPVALLCGRAHYYEGHSLEQVTFPIRVLAAMGVRDLLLTNAAGGINRKFQPGDFMRLTDHLNFMGANPLRGPARDGEPRFPDMSQVYDQKLGQLLDQASKRTKVPLHRGVYLAVSGPSYETPAEIEVFAKLGADAVGMSTVPEAIVAQASGLRVAGLSCITNLAAGRSRRALSHEEVLEAGVRASQKAARLLTEFAQLYAQQTSPPAR